jgi:hypothetical protein
MLILAYVIANALINAFGDIRQKFIRQFQEGLHALVAQLVVHKTALLLPAHQSTIIKTAEVIGSVGLGEACDFNDLANGEWSFAQGFQDAETGGIRKATEELGFEGV